MAAKKKATDEQIVTAYQALGNVWKVAEKFGMGGQSVHERLNKLGIDTSAHRFTSADIERIFAEYEIYANAGKLQDLADAMGRTKHVLCRKAGELGLTDKKRIKKYFGKWKYMTEQAASILWEDFKRSRDGLGMYCKKRGYDDLGFSKTMKAYFADEWDYVIELKTPKQSMYRLGRALEYRVRDDMKKKGFFVMRSPQSKSPVDLVCIRTGGVTFIQCKRSGALPVSEWNEFFDLCRSVGAVPVMAMIGQTGRGIDYFRLIGRKDGSKKRQPMEPLSIPPMQKLI